MFGIIPCTKSLSFRNPETWYFKTRIVFKLAEVENIFRSQTQRKKKNEIHLEGNQTDLPAVGSCSSVWSSCPNFLPNYRVGHLPVPLCALLSCFLSDWLTLPVCHARNEKALCPIAEHSLMVPFLFLFPIFSGKIVLPGIVHLSLNEAEGSMQSQFCPSQAVSEGVVRAWEVLFIIKS